MGKQTIIYCSGHNGFDTCHFKTLQQGNKMAPLPFKRIYAQERGVIRWGATAGNNISELRNAEVQVSTLDTLIRYKKETPVHNRALEKLLGQLDVVENLFEAWYERKEAYNMLLSAGAEMLDFLRNWRKPKYWKRKKSSISPSTLPEAWIAYQFGVKPLIGTIDTLMAGLGQPLTSATFSGSARDVITVPIQWGTVYAKCDYVYKLGCIVSPNSNPNTHLLNLGGLTTPFSTAWSVVPWGWAVDYFVNVSQLLSNFEVRHPGVKIDHSYVTRHNRGTWFGEHPLKQKGEPYCVYDGSFHYTIREIPAPLWFRLQLKFPDLGSNQIANLFSAIALTMKGKAK